LNLRSYTKPQKRELRELVDMAYEIELGHQLDELLRHFQEWKAGRMLASELATRIHEYHQGPNRDLWAFYNQFRSRDDDLLVARGILLSILDPKSLSADLLRCLEPAIALAGELFGNDIPSAR